MVVVKNASCVMVFVGHELKTSSALLLWQTQEYWNLVFKKLSLFLQNHETNSPFPFVNQIKQKVQCNRMNHIQIDFDLLDFKTITQNELKLFKSH